MTKTPKRLLVMGGGFDECLSRKLHELEDNILEFPPEVDDIMLHICDWTSSLHDPAQKIRASIKDEAQGIVCFVNNKF